MNKVNYLKLVLILLKECLLLFFYMIIMDTLTAAVLMIDSFYLKLFLMILILAFYLFMIIIFTKSFGEKQYKAKILGDLRRSKNNQEDIDRYCKPETEYNKFNGLFQGLVFTSILYLMLLIKIIFIGYNSVYDGVIKIIYFIYSGIISLFTDKFSVYYLLLFTLLQIGACVFGYFMGAKKIMLQQEKLEKTHEEIYGKQK